jgi:hypothetical protein
VPGYRLAQAVEPASRRRRIGEAGRYFDPAGLVVDERTRPAAEEPKLRQG